MQTNKPNEQRRTASRTHGPWASDLDSWVLSQAKGREGELSEVVDAVRQGRKCTITGPWGSGKSWLLGTAAAWMRTHDGGQISVVNTGAGEVVIETENDVWSEIALRLEGLEREQRRGTPTDQMTQIERWHQRTGKTVVWCIDDIERFDEDARFNEDTLKTKKMIEQLARKHEWLRVASTVDEATSCEIHQRDDERIALKTLDIGQARAIWKQWGQGDPNKKEIISITQWLGKRPRLVAMCARACAERPIEQALMDVIRQMGEMMENRIKRHPPTIRKTLMHILRATGWTYTEEIAKATRNDEEQCRNEAKVLAEIEAVECRNDERGEPRFRAQAGIESAWAINQREGPEAIAGVISSRGEN